MNSLSLFFIIILFETKSQYSFSRRMRWSRTLVHYYNNNNNRHHHHHRHGSSYRIFWRFDWWHNIVVHAAIHTLVTITLFSTKWALRKANLANRMRIISLFNQNTHIFSSSIFFLSFVYNKWNRFVPVCTTGIVYRTSHHRAKWTLNKNNEGHI